MGSQVSWRLFLVMNIAVLILNVEFIIAEETKVHIVLLGDVKHSDPELVTASHLRILESLVGSKQGATESLVHSYRHGFSGFAAHLTDGQAKKMAEHPDVLHMSPNTYYELQTTRAFDFIGLSQGLPKGLLNDAKMGEDIIIGVLDSGVWPESESFNDRGLGPIPAKWKGQCVDGQQWDSKKLCNKKLIGARYYYMDALLKTNKTDTHIVDDEYMSARERLPHGSHVASTAAGRFVANASDGGLGLGTVRGGAPNARLAVYKVCWMRTDSTCAAGDIMKAFDDAVGDGVDVISISIGRSNPILGEVDDYNQISFGAFYAVSKGITVVSAGGNFGPQANTVQNISPWIITVAASSMDRWFPTPVTLGNGVTIMGRTPYNRGEIQGDLVYVEEPEEITDKLRDKVVLAFLAPGGDPGQYITSFSYGTSGAKALLLAMPNNDVLLNEFEDRPTITLDFELGTTVYKYLKSTSSPTIKISNSKELNGPMISTRIAKFSGRGPNSVSPYVLKPDITAPGMGIVAAITPEKMGAESGYLAQSGTSMATPMVSGVVALLKAVHPDWSPAAIKSALVTSASTTDPYGAPIFSEGAARRFATPFDYGGGLMNPTRAADPGLVYDANMEDYRRFLCASNYDEEKITTISMGDNLYKCSNPRPSLLELNLPSITLPFLNENVTVTRTVTNVGPVNSSFRLILDSPLGINVSVFPKKLHFNATVKKLSYSVTFHTTHRANTMYYFGSLIWNDRRRNVNVTIPLSVRTQRLINFDNY